MCGGHWLALVLRRGGIGACWRPGGGAEAGDGSIPAALMKEEGGQGSPKPLPPASLTLRMPSPFFLPLYPEWCLRKAAWGRSQAHSCVCLSLQDDPEVEKRDPQELVGKFPGSSGHVSEPCRGLRARPLCCDPGLSSSLSGPLAFPTCPGETPRTILLWKS